VVAPDNRIRQVLSSKLGRDTGNPEGFRDLTAPPPQTTVLTDQDTGPFGEA